MIAESFVGAHLGYRRRNLTQHLYQYIDHTRTDGSAVGSQNIGDTANTLYLGTVVHFAVEMVAVPLSRVGRVPLRWQGTVKD